MKVGNVTNNQGMVQSRTQNVLVLKFELTWEMGLLIKVWSNQASWDLVCPLHTASLSQASGTHMY